MQPIINRRQLLTGATAAAALAAAPHGAPITRTQAAEARSDTLSMQLYKSLNDEQREKICLPVDHKSRQYISNWWYVHGDHRINNTFNPEQRDLIQQVFDSLHHPEHRAAVNKQVELDQYGKEKNAPSVGFFGTPDDPDFEFIFTGHHVTRRCSVHSDRGRGFAGAPIFYGHFFEQFNETKDHVGNPYWYQGKLFNQFVQALDGSQQAKGLAATNPRSEKSDAVIKIRETKPPGLACSELHADQKKLLLDTMAKMMSMFRESDVESTLKTMREQAVIDESYISWYGGKYDIGSDKIWDTWTIEGPDIVWYFRGQPHIHGYFHLKADG